MKKKVLLLLIADMELMFILFIKHVFRVQNMPNHFDRFKEFYFRTHKFEESGDIYRILGAHIFSKYAYNGGSYWTKNGTGLPMIIKYHFSREKGLEFYAERLSVGLENEHTFKMFPLVSAITLLQINNPYWIGAWTVVNVAANFYPIMSLRYNRNRARKILERLHKRK